jgi:hypothetical protein
MARTNQSKDETRQTIMNAQIANNNNTAAATITAKVEMRESRYGNPQPTLALEVAIARRYGPIEVQRLINAIGLRAAAEVEFTLGLLGDKEWMVNQPEEVGPTTKLPSCWTQKLEIRLEGSDRARDATAMEALTRAASQSVGWLPRCNK